MLGYLYVFIALRRLKMLGEGLGELCDVEFDVELFVSVCCVQRVGASAFFCASRPMLFRCTMLFRFEYECSRICCFCTGMGGTFSRIDLIVLYDAYQAVQASPQFASTSA